MLSQILLTAMLLKSVVLSTVELFHYWILRFGCDCEFSKAMTENEEKSKRRWKAGSGGLEKRGEKGKRKNDGWNYEGMYWTHLHDKRLYSLRKVVYRLQHAENQTCCQRSWKSQKSRYAWFIANPSEEGSQSSVPASSCSENGGPAADGHRHGKQQKDEAAERSEECVCSFPFFHFYLHFCSQPTVTSYPRREVDLSHGVTDPLTNLLWKHHHRSVFCQFFWYFSKIKPPI